MSKITLNRVASLINAPTSLNGIISQIESAFDRVLFRDGTLPNQMSANLDMNSHRILNLPLAASNNEPLRLGDLAPYTPSLPGLVVSIQEIATEVENNATSASDDAAATAADRVVVAADKATVLAAVGSLPINNYHPESYGCLGNGSANDTVGFRNCIAAAGNNGVIELKPNATYMVCGSLRLLPGQTVIGNGATIKRMAQPTVTTTSTALTSGVTTTFTVASTTGLVVGMDLVVADGTTLRKNLTAYTTFSTAIMRITSIVGSNVTVSTPPNATLASGAKVVNSYVTMVLDSNCKVFNLTIDGNKAARSWSRWETDAEFETAIASSYCTIQHCRIINAACEGIIAFGDYHLFDNNYFSSLNGNGIHFSAAIHPKVTNSTFVTGNLDLDCGHQDGAVIWSNGITDATVHNNFCSAFLSGIGSFDNTDTDATITNNTIRDCYCWGIYTAAGSARLIVSNNRIVNCATNTALLAGLGYASFGGIFGNTLSSADMQFEQNQLDGPFFVVGTAGQTRFIARNNIIRGTSVNTFFGLNDFIISGNIFSGTVRLGAMTNGSFSDNEVNLTGNTSSVVVSLYSGAFNNLIISRNSIIGGSYGFFIDSGTTVTNLIVENNKITDGALRGLVCDVTSGTIAIIGNQITASTNSTTSWIGLVNSLAGANIYENFVQNSSPGNVTVGIFLESGNSKTVLKDNVVRGSYSSVPISTAATGAFLIANAIDGSINDTGSGNTISGTITL